MHPTVRCADMPGGVRLPYVEQGNPDGLPVLLLHGVTDSWRSFEPLLPYLPPSIRAVAVTQRGHRDASRPADGYRIADLVHDVGDFLDALGIDAAVLVGHSMGAVVAQRFAAEHPERVRALLVMGSFNTLGDNEGVKEMWATTVSQLDDPLDPTFVREFQAGTAARPLPPEFLDMVVGESLALPARIWHALFGGFVGDHDAGPLGHITAPTLILWGEEETICSRRDQEKLVAAIPGARFVALPGVSHSVHWEDPTGVARHLMALISRLE